MTGTESTTKRQSAARVAAILLVAANAWVFFEWLFFVTKPSFMSLYSPWEKLGVLSSTALIVLASLFLATVPFAALGWLTGRLKAGRRTVSVVVFLPAILLLAMAMLLLIDNFTLTLFGWGVRNAAGAGIHVYRLLTVALVILAAWLLHGFRVGRYSKNTLNGLTWAAALVLLGAAPYLLLAVSPYGDEPIVIPADGSSLPNILLLSGDGISADHLSVYGYGRPTTPFLDSVKGEFLIAENHFANASDTGGSVISLLSGKLPTTTWVVYPPDALRGQDSFQHLPGILKQLGYYSADISMRHYADPYDLNLRGAFDEANFRRLRDSGGLLVATIRQTAHRLPALNPASLLVDRMSERVSERYGHIWKNKKMRDPLAEVNEPDLRWIQDDQRMEEIRRLMSDAPRPLFVNVLTMGTHGKRFSPTRRVYSAEDDYPISWSVDGYDDAIMDFDRFVEEAYRLLEELDLLESTVLIVSSDHGFKHNALDRVPMMMRLPGQVQTGFIGGNTQRLDIAPTLLDVLGIPPPVWMEGRSMLEAPGPGEDGRPIFASGSRKNKTADGNFWSVQNPGPPWFSLGRLFLVHCDQGFILRLDSMKIEAGRVAGSTAACARQLAPDQAREMMLAHLQEKGYRPRH
jgi:arylsulfatase A-like enzyme